MRGTPSRTHLIQAGDDFARDVLNRAHEHCETLHEAARRLNVERCAGLTPEQIDKAVWVAQDIEQEIAVAS